VTHEVAVIMPAYNAEKTIRRAVESLMRNAHPFDLLVVDDCSRIPVAEVLGPLPANVEVLRLEHNAGVVGARNAGVSRLLARNYVFIGVMDADDVSHPDRLARQIAAPPYSTAVRLAIRRQSAMRYMSTTAPSIRAGWCGRRRCAR
jgi:glycosyltransferase involved in cell wall biosynthesis